MVGGAEGKGGGGGWGATLWQSEILEELSSNGSARRISEAQKETMHKKKSREGWEV